MGMNLTCHDSKGREFNLWQTPTHITWMCLSFNSAGKPDGGMQGVLRRYILWVEAKANGVWEDPEDLTAMRASIREHIKDLRSVRRPSFSYI